MRLSHCAPEILTACRKISEKYDKVFLTGCQPPDNKQPRANATFVVLARNKELDGVLQSIKSVERHFNRWFNYPYVFLNDGDEKLPPPPEKLPLPDDTAACRTGLSSTAKGL